MTLQLMRPWIVAHIAVGNSRTECVLSSLFRAWAARRPRLLEEARQNVEQILAAHQPLPLPAEVERERDLIEKRAREVSGAL